MVMIFQRFSPCSLGISQRDASQVTVDNLTFELEEDSQIFRLFGRRTVGSPVSLRPKDIIRVARERAVKYLKEYSGMVTNHIPKVKAGETCTSFSTSRVRVFMKNVGGNMDLGGDHIEQHSRTRVWMVTRKLQPITGLRADDFWKVFWDIVRCTHSCIYFF